MNNPRIFIVEDDRFFASMLKLVLGKNSYTNVRHFDNGEDFLENIYQNPDLVILDYNLGTMNGLDVLKQIKSINPNIHVIFLSSQNEMNVAVSSLKYGAFDYIEKEPHNVNSLLTLINRICIVDQLSKRLVFKNKFIKWLKIGLLAALTAIVVALLL